VITTITVLLRSATHEYLFDLRMRYACKLGYLIAVANLVVILVLNVSCCGVTCMRHGWVSLTDAVMCMNLINEFWLGIVISYVIIFSHCDLRLCKYNCI